MSKFFLYARKSTDEPDRQILSIEAQITELREFGEREHLEIVQEFVESQTAKEPATGEVLYAQSPLVSATSTMKAIDLINLVVSHSMGVTGVVGGLSSGKAYYYVVVSKDASGNTATSSEQSFTTLAPPPPPPTPPSNLSSVDWIRQFGGSGNDLGWGVATDNNNIYAVGDTPTGFDGQANTGLGDGFIVKYDNNGNKVWVRLLGGAGNNYLKGVTSDGTNIYVVGLTYGSLDGQANAGNTDAIIAKYDTNGNKIWAKQFGAALNDQLYDVAIDNSGNVYASGLTDTSLDGQSSSGLMDALLVKYDKDGNKLWTRLLGTGSYDRAGGLALDSAGNVFMAGWVRAALAGQTSAGGDDYFVAKYAPDGNRLWTKQEGTPQDDNASGISVDSSGNIYVSGQTFGSLGGQQNTGGADAFVIKYDSGGNKLWTRQVGGPGNDVLGKIALSQNNNLFVSGYTFGASYDGQATIGGQHDGYITKFDAGGNKIWSRVLGTATGDTIQGVAANNLGDAFVVGYTYGSFDGSANSGPSDVFIAKYKYDGSISRTGLLNFSLTASSPTLRAKNLAAISQALDVIREKLVKLLQGR